MYLNNTSTSRVNNYEAGVTGLMKGKKASFAELFVTNGRKSVLAEGVMPVGAAGSAPAIRDFAHTARLN